MGKEIEGFRQVLGCSDIKAKAPILLIGSGRFHAISLALKNNRVYILENDVIVKLDGKETKKIKAKRRAAFSRFLAADSIGILVSCKPGQENLSKALRLREKIRRGGKLAYLFLSDNIYLNELENYNIESWLNTSCPVLSFDAKILNLDELPRNLLKDL